MFYSNCLDSVYRKFIWINEMVFSFFKWGSHLHLFLLVFLKKNFRVLNCSEKKMNLNKDSEWEKGTFFLSQLVVSVAFSFFVGTQTG